MKPGYKQTEVGVIPEEWEVSPLGELATFLSGGTPSRSNDEYWTGDIPWISATSLRCFYIYRSGSNVTKEAVAAGSKMAPIGATLLLVRGSALHNEILSGLVTKPVCFNQDVKALVPNSQIAPKYLTFVMLGRAPELLGLVSSAGNTAGVLDTKLLKAFGILLPPVPEQRAIAEALSDVDGLLGGLDRLITKKRDLKQAAMQQLLTGQTRLPGFHGEWEAATIGDVCSFSGGSQPPRSTFKFAPTPGYVRLVQIRDYKSDDFASYIPESLARKRCTSEDIMIGRYGPPIFQILRGIEGAYNVALIKAVLSPKVDRDFFFNVLNQEPLFQLIESLSRRSSGQTGVEIPALKTYVLPLPPLPEQNAIGEVLSEMDAELAGLEQRREKTRALKQAMMQELLTGRTRLV